MSKEKTKAELQGSIIKLEKKNKFLSWLLIGMLLLNTFSISLLGSQMKVAERTYLDSANEVSLTLTSQFMDIYEMGKRNEVLLEIVNYPTQTPFIVTATLEPTPTGYANPNWHDAICIVRECVIYQYSGVKNGDGNMILEPSRVSYVAGQGLVITGKAIQVDGMRVYQIVGPTGGGLWLRINDVKVVN